MNEVLVQTILIYALLAISVQVALRAGVFSLAGVGCWGIAAYTVGILTTRDVPVAVAILAALVASAIICWLLALLLVRLRGLYLTMATVAFNLVVGVLATNGGDLTGGAQGLFGIPIAVGTVHIAIALGIVALLATGLESRALGRSLDVLREDEDLAQALAIDTRRLRRHAFIVSGVVGGLAGALNALTFGLVTPNDVGFGLVVTGLTMVVIGGYHSWLGAVIGAALIQWLPIGLQEIAKSWTLIYGGLLIFVAVYAPSGLLGVVQGVARHVRRMLARGAPAALHEPQIGKSS